MKTAVISVLKKVIDFKRHTPYNFNVIKAPLTTEVEAYYDKETANYLATYGKFIQASRSASDSEFINYLSESIGLENGMNVLDAGCGVCGPAIEFAKIRKLTIEAITISSQQVIESKKNIEQENLSSSIHVSKGDFSELELLYPHNSFDRIFFLETLGYANNFKKVLSGAVKVLKQGGAIYIKDFFLVPVLELDNKIVQHKAAELLRAEYNYKCMDLSELIAYFMALGLYIDFIKPVSMAEDFTKAANFERVNTSHSVYTKVINNPFQLYASMDLKFTKTYS